MGKGSGKPLAERRKGYADVRRQRCGLKKRLKSPRRCARRPSAQLAARVERDERRLRHAARWTKGLNLFEKDFIFVPINEHLHWSLAIICTPLAAKSRWMHGAARGGRARGRAARPWPRGRGVPPSR